MTAYDVKARATAARLLASLTSGGKGQAVTLKTRTLGARNAATGTRVQATTTQTGAGVEQAYSAREIDGTQIKAGDKQFMLSGLDAAGAALSPGPSPSDLLTVGGVDWTIINVDPVQPAGTPIYFVLQLRGPA